MSSAICQNFVQNAWKKELCSNCFKSKDEHAAKSPPPSSLTSKLSKATTVASGKGIIKTSKRGKKLNVNFNKNLTNVIGYGGEDWSASEEEEDEDTNEDDGEGDGEVCTEEEKELQRLTKANTDFNTSGLLNDDGDVKKSYASLMLGKPQVDAEGRKQTLLVSVTPFGHDSSRKVSKIVGKDDKVVTVTPAASKEEKKAYSFLNSANIKNKKEAVYTSNKKDTVILTSYVKNTNPTDKEKSLLDEITETLENSKNPIQIITRKKTQKEITLAVPKIEATTTSTTTTTEVRKNGITRNPVIKRDEKPVIFAKIDNDTNNNMPETPVTSPDDSASNSSLEESTKEDSDTSSEAFPQSRELAGEPDGRADPDEGNEPPALPLTPPPTFDPHINDKPKVPSKPATIAIRKQSSVEVTPQTNVLTTFVPTSNVEDSKPKLVKQDSTGSDIAKIHNKRKAPKPPNEDALYSRNTSVQSDSPIVRELEKRERASSCSPKITNKDPDVVKTPEPAPRKSLSLSTDSLTNIDTDDRKKKEKRNRFSLKKFLRMGSNRDLPKPPPEPPTKSENEETPPPKPKPRLVIVHPLDLNNGKVEVVNKSPVDQVDFSKSRVNKPPPPPRHYENVEKPTVHQKSADLLLKHNTNKLPPRVMQKKVDSVYANIGEVRSSIVPNKPQRTASMRDCDSQPQFKPQYDHHRNSSSTFSTGAANSNKASINAQNMQTCKAAGTYEAINVKSVLKQTKQTENLYEYINGRSGSPLYDKKEGLQLQQRSESSVDVSADYFKYNNMPRSLSLTYCGSETESEIYSPYSCYGSESEVAEDEHEWNGPGGRTHKLRSRKGRSIVHKNLEDNYGAVVIANHEALAQVLENIQHNIPVPPALRGLKNSTSLRWSDFTLKSAVPPLNIGSRAFHQALWCGHHVTLVMTAGSVPTSSLSLGGLSLAPITEFSDLIPVKYLALGEQIESKHLQASVAVLPCVQVNTIQSYGELLKGKPTFGAEDGWKEASFILLQLINALKTLQAQGIEEQPLSLTSFVLCREVDKEVHHRLCVLQSLGEDVTSEESEDKLGTLCMCMSTALDHITPSPQLSPLLRRLLSTERSVSLSQVKSVLEFTLWGPSDVALGSSARERELALQRWLDLQRATVLHGLVCAKVHLTVYEECHLLFLVRSNARMMCDASVMLESAGKV